MATKLIFGILLVCLFCGFAAEPAVGHRAEPAASALLSLFVPGLGELAAGDTQRGTLVLVLMIGVYFSGSEKERRNFSSPALTVLRVASCLSAINCAKEHNKRHELAELKKLEEGYILNVIDEHRVVLSVGSDKGLKEGMKCQVYQDNKFIGTLLITSVFETGAIAEVVEEEAVGKIKEKMYIKVVP